MIDIHAHLRDQNQKHKETLKHGLYVAWMAGLDAVFEMPNTSPEIISRQTIEDRLELADKAIAELKQEHEGFDIFHGLYAGVTANPDQIREIVDVYNDHRKTDKRVVGLKMFAGRSTGDLEIIDEEKQRLVYKTLAELDYRGVLAVHCEKEDYMKKIFDPENPFTHTLARPPEAEVQSVKDQIRFAKEAGYKGTLHICHISVPEALEVIEEARKHVDFRITCGLTPHHAMLYDEMMKGPNGLYRKMNPPLRPREMQKKMQQALIDKRINLPESDHAPHTEEEKIDPDYKPKPFASGVPVFPYWPNFINFLRRSMSWNQIHELTHGNIVKIFDIYIPNSRRIEKTSEDKTLDLTGEYQYGVFEGVS